MGTRARRASTFAAVFLTVAGAYLGGFVAAMRVEQAEMAPSAAGRKDLEEKFQVFWQVWSLVDRYYVDRGKLDRRQMIYGAARGMVASLEDSYTAFSDPESNAALRRELEGNYEGMGLSVAKRDDRLTIVGVVDASPGAQAGLRSGDTILRVDGRDVSSLTLYEAVSSMRGPKGSSARLTIGRPGVDTLLEFEVVRGEVRTDGVFTGMLRGGVAYVKIAGFRQNTTAEVIQTLRKLSGSHPRGLILDLRGNPGGYLNVAVEVASQFLSDGLVVQEEYANGRQRQIGVKRGGQVTEIPMVVLVNGASASAAEIVAGALQDHGRALVMGEQTYGKGSVQNVYDLFDGSGLRVTTAWWLTPEGRRIQGTGLMPDRVIVQDVHGEENRQLERAIIDLLARGRTTGFAP